MPVSLLRLVVDLQQGKRGVVVTGVLQAALNRRVASQAFSGQLRGISASSKSDG